SFPRKRESRVTYADLSMSPWVPAFAGTSGMMSIGPALRYRLNGRTKRVEKFQRERRYRPGLGQENRRVEENVRPERPEHHAAPDELAGRKRINQRKPGLLGNQHAGNFAELCFDELPAPYTGKH